jgi:hypothetical protein
MDSSSVLPPHPGAIRSTNPVRTLEDYSSVALVSNTTDCTAAINAALADTANVSVPIRLLGKQYLTQGGHLLPSYVQIFGTALTSPCRPTRGSPRTPPLATASPCRRRSAASTTCFSRARAPRTSHPRHPGRHRLRFHVTADAMNVTIALDAAATAPASTIYSVMAEMLFTA